MHIFGSELVSYSHLLFRDESSRLINGLSKVFFILVLNIFRASSSTSATGVSNSYPSLVKVWKFRGTLSWIKFKLINFYRFSRVTFIIILSRSIIGAFLGGQLRKLLKKLLTRMLPVYLNHCLRCLKSCIDNLLTQLPSLFWTIYFLNLGKLLIWTWVVH